VQAGWRNGSMPVHADGACGVLSMYGGIGRQRQRWHCQVALLSLVPQWVQIPFTTSGNVFRFIELYPFHKFSVLSLLLQNILLMEDNISCFTFNNQAVYCSSGSLELGLFCFEFTDFSI
jgi:hypothetical protein